MYTNEHSLHCLSSLPAPTILGWYFNYGTICHQPSFITYEAVLCPAVFLSFNIVFHDGENESSASRMREHTQFF